MNNIKRSLSSTKMNPGIRVGAKPMKDVKQPSTSRNKSSDLSSPESNEIQTVLFPIIKQADNSRLISRYTTILSRTPDDGVGMDDLDQLQHDLEKLLSTVAIRNRLLRSEIESLDLVEERRKNKRGRMYDRQLPLKRKKPDEKLKCKDSRNGNRFIKPKHTLAVNNFINDMPVKREVPKVNFPKNDTSDKFWLSIEPYCADVTKDDVAFIDYLIQECSQEFDIKIPEVGEHYAVEWTDELLNNERALSSVQRLAKSKSVSFSNELKKNGFNAMVDTFSSPLTQRLLAALIEENVVTKMPSVNEKLKPGDLCLPKTGARNGVCLDRRLRKELVEQGILDVEDLQKSFPPDDEILSEIKKCVQELKAVNDKNVSQLNQLRTIVAKDIRRQEVKQALEKVDKQIMELYAKILVEKQNNVTHSDDESYEKPNAKQSNNDYEEEANKLIHQQTILHKELTELINATMPLN